MVGIIVSGGAFILGSVENKNQMEIEAKIIWLDTTKVCQHSQKSDNNLDVRGTVV